MNEVRALMTEDAEKAALLNAFFVHTAGGCPEEPHTPEAPEELQIKKEFASVDEGCVTDQFSNMGIHKSMGSDGVHPWVLRELREVIARPPSIIFGKSWGMGEVPEGWRKANVTPVFRKGKKDDLGNYRPVSLTSAPRKVTKQPVLDTISKQLEEKMVIMSRQHRFTKR